MFLSMHMIADWLKPFDPEIHIREGKRTISTVRIIADDINMSSSTVYLNQASPHTIVCANGPDYVILSCDDINIILNSVLDAFEYYNDWSTGLTQQIREGCSLDTVLSAGAELLDRYLVLADPTFLIYYSYGDAELLDRFPAYKKAIEETMLPLDILLTINQSKHIRTPDIPSYEVPVDSMQINTIVTNLFSFTKHNGWLITHNERGLYSANDKDLQDAFSELLQTWMSYNEQSREKRDRESIFRDLIDQKPIDDHAYSRLEVFHWHRNDEIQIYVVLPRNADSSPLYAIHRAIEHFNPLGFVFLYEDHLVYIVNNKLLNATDHDLKLEQILTSGNCVGGKSAHFTDLEYFHDQYEAAKTTAQYALQNNYILANIQQISLPYFSFLIKKNSMIPLDHPDLETLKKYDHAHQTELYLTLRTFLRNQLNYTKTAADLFIHRSTLLYRLDRIKELIPVELDDYENILQLEIAYLLND